MVDERMAYSFMALSTTFQSCHAVDYTIMKDWALELVCIEKKIAYCGTQNPTPYIFSRPPLN